MTPGTNLIVDPSFEDTTAVGAWIDESSTVARPIYSISTTNGVVDGTRAKAFTYVTSVDATPTRYAIDYVAPEGAGYLAVFIEAPEVYATSVFDLVFDQASLVVVG